jgi:hypothetical protein
VLIITIMSTESTTTSRPGLGKESRAGKAEAMDDGEAKQPKTAEEYYEKGLRDGEERKPPPSTAELQKYRGDRRLRRVKMGLSVHPDTVDRLAALGMRFSLSRGMIVDRLVLAMANEYKSGYCHCAHGERCRFDRTEVPEVL